MLKKVLIIGCFLAILFPGTASSQNKDIFTGDVSKFVEELRMYMGSDLNDELKKSLGSFIADWDSASFSAENMSLIANLSVLLSAKQIRVVPGFTGFLSTLDDFARINKSGETLHLWLTGLRGLIAGPQYTNDGITRYMLNTDLLIKENTFVSTGSVRWKAKDAVLKFGYDSAFNATINNGTLTCYSLNDSTEIYHVNGKFYPDKQLFYGTKGVVTWEKAGYPSSDVFAEMPDFNIDVTRNSFTCDSAKLVNKAYFREPVLGKLTDQAASIPSKEKATFPRFETYTSEFRIKNLYKGINYEGGLAFEGAQARGKGSMLFPAKLTLFRNDTLFIKVTGQEFYFSKTNLISQETAATIYFGHDSIFHSNLGFSYNSNTRQVNLFRTNNPVSGSPYYDSYHNLDMYFENLSWDMNSSKIIISRAKGAAIGQAKFESSSFFNATYFLKLMGLDDEHPLTRLMRFSNYYYSETFPVSEFAKWLKKSDEYVTGLCIDMANRGFVFYDRANQTVTIKKKLKDFIDSYAGRKDYDVLSLYSEVKAPEDNASLNLKNFDLTVHGVSNIFLSDSQKVAVFPYSKEIRFEKNRSFRFDGAVAAGLFTIYGHNFEFNYDSFKIKLNKIDSIKVDVETDKKDAYGNPLVEQINNLIQLTSGELYIDDPKNKSGLKSLSQYPIIDAKAYSYIFYDRIPGLEGIYKKEDFYFKVDPFKFENIDHYTNKDLNLHGEFVGGKILKPMPQYLTVQDNNSLGFSMNIPESGIDVYGGKGRLFNEITMSNKGLIGSGTLDHITSTTRSNEFRFFPDSMLTQADTFNITKDATGLFPELASRDVKIKWLPDKDEWLAFNSRDKSFTMFGNGTRLDGSLILSSARLSGSGVVDMTNSRVVSDLFTFNSTQIKADTADYNLKSASTNGYAFVAENANINIDFPLELARFHLNTDSSEVKFPEVQYICKMTDFEYNMNSKILSMEQKGKSSAALMTPDKLLRVNFAALDKPTFFATNSLRDTIAFRSLKAQYNVEKEFIEAEGISYIPVADALIQPENGKIKINRGAKIEKLNNAIVAVNNLHLLHSAVIDMESSRKYSGSGVYDYVSDNKEVMNISFPEITVDTLTTSAKGFIPAGQKFMLSEAFTFTGDVSLSARSKFLTFTGSAGIIQDCDGVKSYPVKFKSEIDPKNVMIPVSDKPRDPEDNIIYSGSFINLDSALVYPAFLSPKKSWSDAGLVTATGYLYYNRDKSQYQIASSEKLVDPSQSGNIVSLNRDACIVSGEGNINFGTNFGRLEMSSAGNFTDIIDSGKVELNVVIALKFYFSQEALKVMNEEIRMTPTLKSVNLNSVFYNKAMKDLLGTSTANQIKEEMDLFGISKNMPKEFAYEILLDDVKLYWNPATSSFRSKGKIGIGFIGSQPVNLYTDGYIEIQRRRAVDMIDIYLKASNSTWYYFSYLKGVMMAKARNENFNSIISSVKEKERKDPGSSSRDPYSYVLAPDTRLSGFLQRMSGDNDTGQPPALDGIVK